MPNECKADACAGCHSADVGYVGSSPSTGWTARSRAEALSGPELKTSWVMVPALAGLILTFIGAIVTSLGLVRDRLEGTLEQPAVMPFRSFDVIAGKMIG